MPAGIYGKLPAKRDFVAANTPRQFLELWEPWLQASVATSRQILGQAWSNAYLNAPIWRFWLGASFCGEVAMGALMPSIDGIGRYFPLTIFIDEREGALAPPEIEPNDAWFAAAELILLDALQPESSFEATVEAAFALAPPARLAIEPTVAGMTQLAGGAVVIRDFGGQAALAFRAGRQFGHRQTFANQTFWWTVGGQGFPPTALIETRMPTPERFAQLLTGGFEPPADAPRLGAL